MPLTQVQPGMLTGNNPAIPTSTAVGTQALNSNSGANNTAVGRSALQSNTTASNNTAVGYNALTANTTGATNVAMGDGALGSNTTASNNVAVGSGCLSSNTTGLENVAVGRLALNANIIGSYCTAVGKDAIKLSTADSNTSIGCFSGEATTTGAQNTYVGQYAGWNNVTGSNNIFIGRDATANGSDPDNQIVLGVSCTAFGNNYFTFGRPSNRVYNSFTTNASWTQSSDVRLKTNIQNDILGLDFICKLKPRTYQWKASNEIPEELTNHYSEENNKDTEVVMNGFIAQEVKEALDAVGNPVFNGWSVEPDGTQAISREMFILPLVKAIQELKAVVDTQATKIAELEAQINK